MQAVQNVKLFETAKLPRGAVKKFREHLNKACAAGQQYRNGRYEQKTRPYGDYLYHQDRDKFFVEMEICIERGEFTP